MKKSGYRIKTKYYIFPDKEKVLSYIIQHKAIFWINVKRYFSKEEAEIDLKALQDYE